MTGISGCLKKVDLERWRELLRKRGHWSFPLFTDGSKRGAGGKGRGGWAVYSPWDDGLSCLGTVEDTTNIRMELMAIGEAVRLGRRLREAGILDGGDSIVVYTDSQFSICALGGEYPKLTKNMDLIERIVTEMEELMWDWRVLVNFVWVKAHRVAVAADEKEQFMWFGNKEADRMATEASGPKD